MKHFVLKTCMLAFMLLASLCLHATIMDRTSIMPRLATARPFHISCYLANKDKSERDHLHRTFQSTDSITAVYEVEKRLLTIYFNYVSHNSAVYIFADNFLVMGGRRAETRMGDSLSFDLRGQRETDFLVVVENQDNGTLFYGYIPNDPRFQVHTTFEFASHKYYANNTPTDSLPPLGYSAAIACDVYPTFYKDIVSTGGTIQVAAESADANCQVFLFRKDNPAAFSQMFTTQVATGDSISRGSMTYSVPAGTYLVVVSAETACSYKMCNVTINDTTYTNQWLACNRFDFPINPINSQTVYDSFVRGWHCHPQLLILGSNNTVVAYQDCQQTGYTNGWSNNIHIRQSYSAPTTGALVIPTGAVAPPSLPYLYHGVSLASLYVGCKKVTKNLDRKGFNTAYYDSLYYASDNAYMSSSVAWTCGLWQDDMWPDRPFEQYHIGDNVTSVERFDTLFASFGYTRTNATYNSSAIDLRYKNTTPATWLASVKAYSGPHAMGYGWETKLDKRARLFHPRGAISEADYDAVYYYRRMTVNDMMNTTIPPAMFTTSDSDNLVYENEVLSDDYYDVVTELLNEVSLGDWFDFLNYFYAAFDVLHSDTLSSFNALLESSEYGALVNFCLSNTQMLYCILACVADGEELGETLLEDTYAHDYPAILQQVWAYNNSHRTNGNQRLRRTRMANAQLFTKYYIDDLTGTRRAEERQRHDVSYSDDPTVLSVSAKNNSLTIGFNLKSDANVSLGVSTPYGEHVTQLISKQHLSAGDYRRQVGVQRSGVYIVTMRENGRIYNRKVIVK